MERLIQKTVESFTFYREKDKKYYCDLCGAKSYTTEKMCYKHITENHQNHPDFINRMVDLKAERTAQDIEYYKVSITNTFTVSEQDWLKKRTEFMDRFSKDTISSALSWYAEVTVKEERKYEIMNDAKFIFNGTIKDDWSRDKVEQFVSKIKTMIENIKYDLIRNPYRHSSTSLMSNAVEEWKAYAKAYMANGQSFSALTTLIYYAEKLLEII